MSDLLITTSTFPLSEHSTEPRFIFDLAQALTAHFQHVHVLAPAYLDVSRREQWGKLDVHRFNYFWPRLCQRLCYGYGMVQNVRRWPWLLCTIPLFVICQYVAILKLCRRYPIRWVNSHWLIFQGLAGAMGRARGRYRHTVHVHAAGLYTLIRLPRWLGRRLARYIMRRSDHVICESRYVRDRLDDLIGFASNASVSCMGVYTEKFASAPETHDEQPGHLVFVGRFVEKKGVEYLLRAIPLVRQKIPGAHLTLVGSGFLERQLRQTARELNLGEDIVNFRGSQPHHIVARILREAAVVAVPSIVDARGETEGMPTVILEALAAGKRVVASRVNGTTDIIEHGKNGWLCDPEDPEALAEALVTALSDEATNIRYVATETAMKYDWTNLATRYASYIKS